MSGPGSGPVAEPGDEIGYTVTWLEMAARPEGPRPVLPGGQAVALLHAVRPPVRYFLHLYDSVGADYEWTDMHRVPGETLAAFLHHEAAALYTMMVDGWPGGFFLLDWREAGTCDLAYFGLVPEAVGRGLGAWLLATAIDTGWARPGVQRMTVNTNTLDHPRALPLYQRFGFEPVRREERRRVATRRHG